MNEVFTLYDRWNGLIPFLGGIFATLIAYGYLPRKPKDPEIHLLWHKKFGGMMKILGPLLIFFGAASLISGLSHPPINLAAKRIFIEFNRANQARAASGASIQSAERFLKQLQSIDLSAAPADLKNAVQDYTNALAGGLAAIKNGKPSTVFDGTMLDARRRLSEIEKNTLPY